MGGQAKLAGAGIETARLDCLVLLEDVLNTDRAHLLAHPDFKLTTEQLSELDMAIARREAFCWMAAKSSKTSRLPLSPCLGQT